MSNIKHIAFAALILTLAGCDSADIEATCFSYAAHEKLSDGKIQRVCSCQAKQIAKESLNEKELIWVTSLIKKKEMNDKKSDSKRLSEVTQMLSKAVDYCGSAQ